MQSQKTQYRVDVTGPGQDEPHESHGPYETEEDARLVAIGAAYDFTAKARAGEITGDPEPATVEKADAWSYRVVGKVTDQSYPYPSILADFGIEPEREKVVV